MDKVLSYPFIFNIGIERVAAVIIQHLDIV